MRRVVIVHERLTEVGGSERVVEEMFKVWPQARLVVPIADRCVMLEVEARRVSTTALQRLYRHDGRYGHLLPLLPLAFRRMPLSDAELVVTSHHAFANRVLPPAGTPLLSYVHTPARWIWDPRMRRGEGGVGTRAALAGFAATQRLPDRRAAGRPVRVLVNSTAVAERVRRWWRRDACVVAPPVRTDFYTRDPSTAREDFFLLAGRLVPYKRPEVAVAAALAAGVRLVVAGDGRASEALRQLADDRVTFLGRVSDETLRDLFRRCRALVFPGEEDFGIVPVEAQACGAPVVALGAGGALDTVVDGVTGMLVPPGASAVDDVSRFARAMRTFADDRYDGAAIRRHAERFSAQRFRANLVAAAAELDAA